MIDYIRIINLYRLIMNVGIWGYKVIKNNNLFFEIKNLNILI